MFLIAFGSVPLPYGDVFVIPRDSFATLVVDLAYVAGSPVQLGKGFALFDDGPTGFGDAPSGFDDVPTRLDAGLVALGKSFLPNVPCLKTLELLSTF